MAAVLVRDRDDACPGVVDTSPADDGLIARVRLPGGRLDPARLRELAELAERFGTGSVDLTARANIQVRGLAEADVPAFAHAVAAAGLMPSRSHDRVRNILASPLAGRDPLALLDADAVLAAVDSALCATPELTALSGRFLIGIDDGGVPIASARHDLDLIALTGDTFALHAAGHDTGWRVTPANAAGAIVHAARAFLTARAAGGAWHIRELPGGAAEFAACLATDPVRAQLSAPAGTAPRERPRAGRSKRPLVGVSTQSDGRYALGALVPLGRLTQHHLAALVEVGAELRITTARGIVLRDLLDPAAATAGLEAAGLPCDPASPWRGVTACSGQGACRRARSDVRTDATRHALGHARSTTEHLAPLGATDTHWVGCARACGRPAGATLLVACEDGGYEIVPPGGTPTPG
ncbi:precorrin-3B synthase [Embleya sp. AB8]|uniref:precorrin-3B synthase n=1 Tax=Embleya sp. AB8 TaxID=3156304 RepID=UPI003C71A894